MIVLNKYPRNTEKFRQLLIFLSQIIDVCKELKIEPVLNGSLAVFAYTNTPNIEVNDIDLSCSELDFQKITQELERRKIDFKLKEWHVLQILENDLKIEFDSKEYWMWGISANYETLQINDGVRHNMAIKMVTLRDLKELYKRGLENTKNSTQETDKAKYASIKKKLAALNEAVSS